MLKRTLSPRSAAARLGTRAAVVAAGLGATAALGAGFASAADGPVHAAPAAHTASVQVHAATHGKTVASHKAAGEKKKGRAGGHATAHKKAAAHKAITWVKPVHHYELTATFDQGGSHWMHKHSGQDFAVPVGTPVSAAHSGVIVKAGPNGGGDGPAYGNAIVISHGNGTYSQYAHLSQIDVHIGEHVKAGEHIALSGNTGNTTGPHLHFEIRSTPNYGSAVNPVTFLDHHGLHV